MIAGSVGIHNNNTTKAMKMMIHDIRSPLSCLMMCCNFSLALTKFDQESLLKFTEQISKIADSATNMNLFVHQMRRTLSSFKAFCDQATRILDNDKAVLFRSIERMSDILDSPGKHVGDSNKAANNINILASINNILSEKKLECLGSSVEFLFTKPENVKYLHINGSTADFERMLSNLLNNAVEACSGKQGIVSINLELTDKSLYLIIEDNGKGIPEHVLQQIQRGISVTNGKEKGQGIGLTQIRQTIARLNGRLDIKSEIGHGSKFIITINRFIHH